MTAIFRADAAITSPPPSMPLYVPLLGGTVTLRSLVAFHRFDDANPSASSVDLLTGQTATPAIGGSGPTLGAVSNLSGGGVRMERVALYPVRNTVDMTQPWTWGACMTINTTSVSSSNIGVVSTPTYATRGVLLYTQPGTITGALLVTMITRFSVNGVQGAAATLVGTAANFRYGQPFVIFMIHSGAGAVAVEIWQSSTMVASGAFTYDPATVQGPGGSLQPNQLLGAGSPNTGFTGGDLNVEAQAAWTKALRQDEKATNYSYFASLASSRSRPIP
jgi:hypothetical protein